MLDKILGVLAMAMLIGFLGILVGFVREPALAVVIAIVVVMGIGDFYFTLFKDRKSDSGL